jgi:hypothetical protein
MNKFKAGDKVKRIASVHDGMKVGDIAVVKYVENVWTYSRPAIYVTIS